MAMLLDYWGERRLNHHTEATSMLYAALECARILVSEGLDRDLTLIERTRMRLHLIICRACTTFDTQMALIRRAMRKLGADDDAGPGGEPT